MALTVIRPGLLTTIQDLGRFGFQKYGVIASGAMDPLSHRIANLLVGNPEQEATLEITMVGPLIEFSVPTLIAICGGDLSPALDGVSIPMYKPVLAEKGSRLSFGKARNGCRTYLAVAGGFSIAPTMNSKSTYLRAGIGGYNGRALQAGDIIPCKEWTKRVPLPANWGASRVFRIKQGPIRAIKGKEFPLFSAKSQTDFFSQPFSVTLNSDRMGYRLSGPKLTLQKPTELVSEAVSFGTIQVPSDGNPIALLADRQTTGGYPRIAAIISVDLPNIAQAKPRDTISFQEIPLAKAQQLYIKQELDIKELKARLSLIYK
ncbi:MAG: biotin-dependent carboxyltransferase family protein [Ectobacillus sp.]